MKLISAAFLLSGVLLANAQTFRGAINGTVTDPSGAVVPNAQLEATDSATGVNHSSVTTTEGQFFPPGHSYWRLQDHCGGSWIRHL